MNLAAIILATLSVPAMTGSAAQAEVSTYGFQYGATNCGFVSGSQCKVTVSGIGGICTPNPRYFAYFRSNCGQPVSLAAARPPIRQAPQ
jgi:hypothetical protein